ncbi:MAG: redox-sensing transcriptional repressor Rex [Petrotogales bacterium]
MYKKIPKPTIKRLAIYYRCIEKLLQENQFKLSSKELGEHLGIKASQVRKDLSYFGEFGKRGVGYNTSQLLDSIGEILGIRKTWSVVVVGAGNLGRAICNFEALKKSGFIIKDIFDKDKNKIGKELDNGLIIKDIDELNDYTIDNKIDVGVITVPANSAQKIANKLVNLKIKGIINFAPAKLKVPEHIKIEDLDISVYFRSLSFQISMQQRNSKNEQE